MRSIVLTLAAAAVLAVVAGTAEAANRYRGPSGPTYAPNYAPNYGYQVNNYYGGWGGRPYYPSGGAYFGGGGHFDGGDMHSAAVRRIMAAHSRYRYYEHPRSMYNSPPTQADYFGWGWGY